MGAGGIHGGQYHWTIDLPDSGLIWHAGGHCCEMGEKFAIPTATWSPETVGHTSTCCPAGGPLGGGGGGIAQSTLERSPGLGSSGCLHQSHTLGEWAVE